MTNWQTDLGSYYRNRGKIENFAGILAVKDMEAANQERAKNREAESQFARRQWGQADSAATDGDDMGHTILGDINHPAPIIMPPQNNSGDMMKGLALGAALLGIPAAGVLGYMLNKNETEATQPIEFDDASVSIGLGRIEDYIDNES